MIVLIECLCFNYMVLALFEEIGVFFSGVSCLWSPGDENREDVSYSTENLLIRDVASPNSSSMIRKFVANTQSAAKLRINVVPHIRAFCSSAVW